MASAAEGESERGRTRPGPVSPCTLIDTVRLARRAGRGAVGQSTVAALCFGRTFPLPWPVVRRASDEPRRRGVRAGTTAAGNAVARRGRAANEDVRGVSRRLSWVAGWARRSLGATRTLKERECGCPTGLAFLGGGCGGDSSDFREAGVRLLVVDMLWLPSVPSPLRRRPPCINEVAEKSPPSLPDARPDSGARHPAPVGAPSPCGNAVLSAATPLRTGPSRHGARPIPRGGRRPVQHDHPRIFSAASAEIARFAARTHATHVFAHASAARARNSVRRADGPWAVSLPCPRRSIYSPTVLLAHPINVAPRPNLYTRWGSAFVAGKLANGTRGAAGALHRSRSRRRLLRRWMVR